MSAETLPTPAFAVLPERESCAASIDLNGPWQFKATDENEWLEALVPGEVHTDLLRAGRLADPFYRDNELKVQWVEKKEWEYRRGFTVGEDFLRHDRIVLDCRGLDTIAEVYLNGVPVAATRNMFIEHEFDVKPLLHPGGNELRIVFRSVLEWIKRQNASDPRVVWEDIKGNSFFTRKCASDFGWDWGFRLLGCGIWRPIRLAAYDTGRIMDLRIEQDLSDPRLAVLDITAEIQRMAPAELRLEIEVSLDGATVARETVPVADTQAKRRFHLEDPKLWWPNGWGDQPLYTIAARLLAGRTIVHTRKLRTGLRTVALVQEKDDRGLTFGLKINGHLIFCKGANWIPAGLMRAHLTVPHYEHLLRSCQETHMNMLRLWGGGVYEAEVFYDYCDEFGLMIWHDFMFAGGPYLGNESYLENVRQEIADVVRRLRSHPSIVLWCGNNEQESSMPSWVKEYATVNWEEYDKVFYEAIPKTAALHDPERPYWPCSPHHPLDRTKTAPNYRTASGDAHVWEVWHHEEPFSWYGENLDFRFVSEYGLQSLPDMETILSFTAPEDRHFISRVLDLHNKAGKKSQGTENMGNIRLAKYVSSMFRMPADLENWVYVTQIMQGEAMKAGAEAYRRNYPRTTGALYWQLDDNWPTISGSAIDYYGRWKALMYMTRYFFSPVLICGAVEETGIKLWGVNDLLREIPATLSWSLASFDGDIVKRGEQTVMLPANSSTLLADLDLAREIGENPEHITYRNTNYENRSRFYLAYQLAQGDRVLSANVSFFAPWKYLALTDPGLKCEVSRNSPVVTVSAERFAAYVELGLRGRYARFSDNYFHLLPGEAREIAVIEGAATMDEVKDLIYAKSLVDSFA